MTRTGAPLGALLRRSHHGDGPRFLRRSFTPPSASSWQGIVVSPGGAPPPPGCVAANHARGRRPSPRPGIAGRRLPDLGTCSPVPPLACSTLKTPHECAPFGRSARGEYLREGEWG